MSKLLALALLAASAGGADAASKLGKQWQWMSEQQVNLAIQTTFEDWKLQFNKAYASPEEEHQRFMNYLRTREEMLAHADPNSQVAPNHYADLTPEERRQLRGNRPPLPMPLSQADLAAAVGGNRRRLISPACAYPFACYPAELDWTTVQRGGGPVVTPVKDQVRGAAPPLNPLRGVPPLEPPKGRAAP